MENMTAAQFIEVPAGILTGLTLDEEVWRFIFQDGLTVESYAGWCLYEHDAGAKRLIGSRDLLNSKDPFQDIHVVLGDATCEMITFNAISNTTQLQLLRGDDRLSLELLANSAKLANWKIIYADMVETDIE
ncbi:MAG: hypothetical protein ABW068_07900 [Candidatus Thiodiazotropha sp.]